MAADTGELDVVRWVIDRDVQTNGKLLTDLGGEVSLSIHAAAVNGHLEVAKYLRARAKKPKDSFQRAVEAAEYRRNIGALSIQLPYTKKDRIVSGKTMSKAAKKGYLDVIKWLCSEYGDDPGVDLFDYDEDCLWSLPVMDAAADNGNLEVVKYLHSLQVTMDSNERKRKRGELKSRTSPKCTKQAMDSAAENGHFEVVKWLHYNREEGCTNYAMGAAAKRGHLEIVQWLQEHRSEGCTTAAMDSAAQNGHLNVVKWLHENTDVGCTTQAFDQAATFGYLDIMKWLNVNRSEGCTSEAMDRASGNGMLHIVKWLHANRPEKCTQAAMTNAVDGGSFDIVRWLHLHCRDCSAAEAIGDAVTSNQFEIFLYLHDELHVKCIRENLDVDGDGELYEWILELYPEFQPNTSAIQEYDMF